MTAAADRITIGHRKIILVWNDYLEQWPDSGFGVINYESEEFCEFFNYYKRSGNELFLKEGLKKNHAKYSDIRTSNFYGWKNHIMVSVDTGKGAMFGRFGAKFHIQGEKYVSLNKDILTHGKFNLNFHVRISGDLLKSLKAGEDYGFADIKPGNIFIDIIKLKTDGPCFFSISRNEQQRITSQIEIVPDKQFCINAYFMTADKNDISAELWVDNIFSGKIVFPDLFKAGINTEKFILEFGNPNQNPKQGLLFLDHITVSDEYIPDIPPVPSKTFSVLNKDKIELVTENSGYLFQWQISKNNSWLLPDFNSGIMEKNRISIQYNEYPDLLPGFRWRVRYAAGEGVCGDWCIPVKVNLDTANGYTKPQRDLQRQIIRIRIHEPDNLKEVDKIEKNKWYDVFLDYNSNISDSISYADLWLEYAASTRFGTDSRGAFPFLPSENYWLSLSAGDSSLWASAIPEFSTHTNITRSDGLFWSDSLGVLSDKQRGWLDKGSYKSVGYCEKRAVDN
ncbi:MAG: hypothetical protein ABIA63_13280 [bacterium]